MTKTKPTSSSSLLPDTSVASSNNEKLSTTVSKPTPYTYDLPHLTITDPNPLPPSHPIQTSTDLSSTLHSIARDAAQSLISTLLTTIPIQSTEDGLTMIIPSSSASLSSNNTTLPRFKPLPKPRVPTKWETFAKKKGIGKYNSSGGARYSENRKNLVYDEAKGEWVRKWGYKGKNKDGENDWLVEVDDKKKKQRGGAADEADGGNVRSGNRKERMERVRRQDRRQRRNDERSRRSEKSR